MEKVVTLAKILVNVLKFFFEKHLTVKHSILLLSSPNERNVWQFCKAHSKDKNHLLMNKINFSRSFFSESALQVAVKKSILSLNDSCRIVAFWPWAKMK